MPTLTWQLGTSVPNSGFRQSAFAQFSDDKWLYLFYISGGSRSYRLDMEGDSYETLSVPGTAFFGDINATTFENDIYVHNGNTPAVDRLRRYEPPPIDGWTNGLTDDPFPSSGPFLAGLPGVGLVTIGGRNAGALVGNKKVRIYVPGTDLWITGLTDWPGNAGGITGMGLGPAVTVGDRVWIFVPIYSGLGTSVTSVQSWYYDYAAEPSPWTRGPDLTGGDDLTAVYAPDGYIYVGTGNDFNGSSSVGKSVIWRVDPVAETACIVTIRGDRTGLTICSGFEFSEEIPHAIAGGAAMGASREGGLYVVGGDGWDTGDTNDYNQRFDVIEPQVEGWGILV